MQRQLRSRNSIVAEICLHNSLSSWNFSPVKRYFPFNPQLSLNIAWMRTHFYTYTDEGYDELMTAREVQGYKLHKYLETKNIFSTTVVTIIIRGC